MVYLTIDITGSFEDILSERQKINHKPKSQIDIAFEAFVQYEGIGLYGRSWACWIGNIV